MLHKRCAAAWLCVAMIGVALDVYSTFSVLINGGSERTPFPAWLVQQCGIVPGLLIAFGIKMLIVGGMYAAMIWIPKTKFFLDEQKEGRVGILGTLWFGAGLLLALQVWPVWYNFSQ